MARLLQLSDLHVVAPGALVSRVLDTPALLRNAIDVLMPRLDAIGPLEAVLITGDVSDDGSAESYVTARAELDRLGLPILVVPGNHDRREGLREAFRDLPGIPGAGLIEWVIDLGDTRVVGLDTLVEGQGGGRLRAESLDLLSRAIEGAGDRAVVVALHHPPLRTGIRFMDAIGLENLADLAAAMSNYAGSIHFVAGHVHGVFQGRIGQHPVATAPSLCSAFALDRRKDARVGFMTGPTGCAVLDTGPGGTWAALPLDHGEGPFDF